MASPPSAFRPGAPVPDQGQRRARLPRGIQLGLVITGVLWATVAAAAARLFALILSVHSAVTAVSGLARVLVYDGLLATGFTLIVWLAIRQASLREVNKLPWRSSGGAEWRAGLVIGWGMALLAVLPMALAGDLQPSLRWDGSAWAGTLVSLLTLLFVALAAELLFRGFLLARLSSVLGPTWSVLLLSVAAAILSMGLPDANWTSVCVTLLLAVLLSVAYLRTHALWLGWGLHFGWLATQAVLFGLPAADISYVSVVQSNDVGKLWLTGGFFGPAGSWISAVVVLLAFPLIYAVTRDWAWAYTHELPVGAAYAVVVQPPAEHTRMEAHAAAAEPLVQILPSTPAAPSTMAVVNEHLRDTE